MNTTYALLDLNGIVVNAVIAEKDDFATLDRILIAEKESSGAVSYKEIDPEIYNLRVGLLRWDGSNWTKVEQA